MELSGRQVEIEIGTIVLENVGPCDGRAVGHAASLELERLLGEATLPASLAASSEQRTLNAPSVTLPRGVAGASLGVDVARAVYGALDR